MTPDIDKATQIIRDGGIIAYPTEAVFGLGCDPMNEPAVMRLLDLKQRSVDKGLILIASNQQQLNDYIEPPSAELQHKLDATWPGPVTWVMPCKPGTPAWLTGGRDTLAVRVTAHSLAAALCDALGGPIVSTSANVEGQPPARSAQEVRAAFGDSLDYILEGETGKLPNVSEIRDAATGKVLRPAS